MIILLKIICILVFWFLTVYLNFGLIMAAAMAYDAPGSEKDVLNNILCAIIILWLLFCYLIGPILLLFFW